MRKSIENDNPDNDMVAIDDDDMESVAGGINYLQNDLQNDLQIDILSSDDPLDLNNSRFPLHNNESGSIVNDMNALQVKR